MAGLSVDEVSAEAVSSVAHAMPCGRGDCTGMLVESAHRCSEFSALTVLGASSEARTVTLSYLSLFRAARSLVQILQLTPGQRLALLAPDSVVAPLSVLAAMLVGTSLVPLGPTEPIPRLECMLRATSPTCAVVHQNCSEPLRPMLAGAISRGAVGVFEAEQLADEVMMAGLASATGCTEERSMTQSAVSNSPRRLNGDMESHVYFTSGSTGEPKGCIVTRGNLLAYCLGKNVAHGVESSMPLDSVQAANGTELAAMAVSDAMTSNSTSVCFVASAHTFDPWLTDLCAAWLAGAHAAVAPRNRTFTDLGGCLRQVSATHVLTTPALFGTLEGRWLPGDLPCLKVVALGGEVMDVPLVVAWAPHVMLLNTYGVTECCGYQAIARVRGAEDRNLIGSPLGENILLLARAPGDDPLTTVASDSGEIGELWLAGTQVGLGYVGSRADAAANFVEVPSLGRCYRTGDLARAENNGQLRLLGRRDTQLKVRGNRVEPGEIEAVLHRLSRGWFRRVAVVKASDTAAKNADADGLLAWCELSVAEAVPPPRQLASAVLRLVCKAHLPAHMTPRDYHLVVEDGLPLTSSGKVDRRALTGSHATLEVVEDAVAGETPSDTFTGWEAFVAQAWEHVLRVPVADANADFAALSGDSLTALRVVREIHTRLRQAGGALGETTNAVPLELGSLGELAEALAPAHLLAHTRLVDYAAHLESAFGGGCTSCVPSTAAAQVSRSDPGETLFRRCCAANATPLLEMLLQPQILALSRDTLDDCLRCACGQAAVGAAEFLLLRSASPTAADGDGQTPLHKAAQSGCFSLVQSLLTKHNACAWQADAEGQTPTHHAARRGRGRRILELLLEHLAKPSNSKVNKAHGSRKQKTGVPPVSCPLDVKDHWGRTPLHWAVDNGHRVEVDVLLAAGAQHTLADTAGETPLQVAERRAQCSARDRPGGLGASVFGDIATLLGGSAKTRRSK
eukprot:TRINITY_DN73839_c0_g1_i1.p1 TRINITY_DN73839_c0_g1~~TRINITY_DN73839_c0_g1_i1.p1  ORF type:complete len:965 (+),score=134.90 TRINITY_DN73839_c0_g1_i1:84-2978(+)